MKIGLISINMYAKYLNYACPIHTFAFQQFLKENGIESTIIDYQPVHYTNFDLRHPADYYASEYDRLQRELKPEGTAGAKEQRRELEIVRKRRDSYRAIYREREIRHDKFQRFINDNYVKTDRCYDSDLLEVLDPGFDCYICVTDVIWRRTERGFDRGFFLASRAMENKWKIAYAASRGAHYEDAEAHHGEEFFHYVEDIDRIAVREESLKQYIEENSDKEVKLVLDPVLLHTKEFYENYAVKPEKKGYVFLYYVEERAKDTAAHAAAFARKYHLPIVEVTDRPSKKGRIAEFHLGEGLDVEYRYDVGIEEWLGYIMHADYVFTNSFHCCCFSTLFERDFYVGARAGDKVTNFLQMLHLEQRRIAPEWDYGEMNRDAIDYDSVREILNQKRKESSEFILSAIHECEGKVRPKRDYDTWKKKIHFPVSYNSGAKLGVSFNYGDDVGTMKFLASGTLELAAGEEAVNNGNSHFLSNGFAREEYEFVGWYLRIRIDKAWFWYMQDGTLCPQKDFQAEGLQKRYLFSDRDIIPFIPVNQISHAVAQAVWRGNYEYRLLYNSGVKSNTIRWKYNEQDGKVKTLPSGSHEFVPQDVIQNTIPTFFKKNQFIYPGYTFVGWRLRVRVENQTFWYLENDTLYPTNKYKEISRQMPVKIFEDESQIPCLPKDQVDSVVVEAVWKKQEKSSWKERILNRLTGR